MYKINVHFHVFKVDFKCPRSLLITAALPLLQTSARGPLLRPPLCAGAAEPGEDRSAGAGEGALAPGGSAGEGAAGEGEPADRGPGSAARSCSGGKSKPAASRSQPARSEPRGSRNGAESHREGDDSVHQSGTVSPLKLFVLPAEELFCPRHRLSD